MTIRYPSVWSLDPRKRRLQVTKTVPDARCAYCGTPLPRVDFPRQHVARCKKAHTPEVGRT